MVKTFSYLSGDDVRPGDHIRYHGEAGTVDFVVPEKVGDPSIDWYVEQFPGGGFMVTAENFGQVFLRASDIDESLEFVARGEKG